MTRASDALLQVQVLLRVQVLQVYAYNVPYGLRSIVILIREEVQVLRTFTKKIDLGASQVGKKKERTG